MVTVQEPRGYDVGRVSLKGHLAEKQYARKNPQNNPNHLHIVYRKSNEKDINTWLEGKKNEPVTLIKARAIVLDFQLPMKISDVEYQGDFKKATFYYIADERIDFRELIKVYAKEFHVNIDMKQIGARQEASKIGGIGSCGKVLCCSTWRNHLPSVSMNTIQAQQLSSSMEKYTGQCGKLKCCLTYELENYLDAKQDFPKQLLELETKKGIAYPIKIDILKKTVWYSYKIGQMDSPVEITLDQVKDIIMRNKKGQPVESLENLNNETIVKTNNNEKGFSNY